MAYLTLQELPQTRQDIDTFYGYNHKLRISDGEFYDMQNMTSDNFPVLSPRRRRGTYASPAKAQGLIAKEHLCYVDGTDFVIDSTRIDMGLSDSPKSLVSMGAYVIIMPDKKYINTADTTDNGDIEAAFTTTSSAAVEFTLCRVDGESYTVTYTQESQPSSPANGALWVDTSSDPHSLKQWSATSKEWVAIATTYIKIAATGIGAQFSQYDGVTITGLAGVSNKDIAAIEGSHVLWDVKDDYIVVVGMLDKTESVSVAIKVAREMPNMDFITESENRLWGCRCGTSVTGDQVNEIYASKLGDFKNWNCFMGLSTDSYAVSLGSDGAFTGAITHRGYPLFFKENCMHKVYGSMPSNYQMQTTACRGVQQGCDKSLAIVNETLYYKAQSGVCAYDGSLPVEISDALGDTVYADAVAGAHGNKYYISMKNPADEYSLFVYDSAKGMWHKEDATRARAFCTHKGEMYFIDDKTGAIKTMRGSGTPDSRDVEWMAETGVIGTDMPDKKYISRLNIRMSLEVGARMYIFAEYDSTGGWNHVTTITGRTLRSFSIPFRPRRCDHMRLRFVGEGDAKIYSITKTVEQGSDY